MSTIDFLRSFRVGPFAVFDFAASFAAAYLVARRTGWPLESALWSVLPVSVIAHALTGRPTPLTRMTLEPGTHYAVKMLMLYAVYKMFQ